MDPCGARGGDGGALAPPEKPYNQMTTQQFRETVAMGSKRPHVERRWPRSIQRLLRRCWDADPVSRPSFGEILKAGILEQARFLPIF